MSKEEYGEDTKLLISLFKKEALRQGRAKDGEDVGPDRTSEIQLMMKVGLIRF